MKKLHNKRKRFFVSCVGIPLREVVMLVISLAGGGDPVMVLLVAGCASDRPIRLAKAENSSWVLAFSYTAFRSARAGSHDIVYLNSSEHESRNGCNPLLQTLQSCRNSATSENYSLFRTHHPRPRYYDSRIGNPSKHNVFDSLQLPIVDATKFPNSDAPAHSRCIPHGIHFAIGTGTNVFESVFIISANSG